MARSTAGNGVQDDKSSAGSSPVPSANQLTLSPSRKDEVGVRIFLAVWEQVQREQVK